MSGTIIPAKYDFVFKRLFGDKKHIKTLTAFLKAVLDLPEEELKTLTLGDTNLIPRYIGGKRFVLDLRLETASGKIIDVEIQVSDTKEMPARVVAYESRMISEQLGKGDDYRELQKVITILITDFSLLEKTAAYHQKFMVRNEDAGITLTDIFEIHTLELNKLPLAEDGSKVWRWLKLLQASRKEELDMLQRQYPELQEPVVILKELSADEALREEQRAYEKACRDEAARLYWAKKEGLTEGEARGEARGRAEGRAEVARSMLKRQMPIDVIVELTGLAREEVVLLQQQ